MMVMMAMTMMMVDDGDDGDDGDGDDDHRAEAIVLHDVARHLPELSQVPLPPVDSDVAHLVIIVIKHLVIIVINTWSS